jgi:hypothetical protein
LNGRLNGDVGSVGSGRIVGDPDIGLNGAVGSITRKDTKRAIRREAPISDNWLQLSSRRLQTQVVNDKGRYRQHLKRQRLTLFRRYTLRPKVQVDHSPRPEFLLASGVSLRCLDRSVSEQELNLFEFAAGIMAESGTGATIVTRQVGYAGLSGAPLDCIPDYVGCHPGVLSPSLLRNPSEQLAHPRMPEPSMRSCLHH